MLVLTEYDHGVLLEVLVLESGDLALVGARELRLQVDQLERPVRLELVLVDHEIQVDVIPEFGANHLGLPAREPL